MNKRYAGQFFIITVVLLAALGGCKDFFPSTPETGQVILFPPSAPLQRTVLPADIAVPDNYFDSYEADFARTDGLSHKDTNIPAIAGYSRDLEKGTWVITVRAYKRIDGVLVQAAEGSVSGISISVGTSTYVTAAALILEPLSLTAPSPGFLRYTVLFPIGTSGTLHLSSYTGPGNSIERTLSYNAETGGAAGSFAAPAGSYNMTIKLTNSAGQSAGTYAAVHIYPGLESVAAGDDFTFTNADFASRIPLEGTVTVKRSNSSANITSITISAYDNPEREGDPIGTSTSITSGTNFSGATLEASANWYMSIAISDTVYFSFEVKFSDAIIIINNEELGNLAGKSSGISGITLSSYQIDSRAELAAIGADLASLAREYYLMEDINLGCTPEDQWISIGSPDSPFTGKLYGNNHLISNIYINTTADNQGLFRVINKSGIVENLRISGEITGHDYVGGIAGSNYGSITGCSFSNKVSGHDYVGGIAGYNGLPLDASYPLIAACRVSGEILGHDYLGGIVGHNEDKIIACYSNASVSGDSYIGGVVGYNAIETIACYSTGPVAGTSFVGGVAGSDTNSGEGIIACYYRADGDIPGIGGVGSGGTKFSDGWPSVTDSAEWGIGDGSGSGKYWSNLGSSPTTYPQLWWE